MTNKTSQNTPCEAAQSGTPGSGDRRSSEPRTCAVEAARGTSPAQSLEEQARALLPTLSDRDRRNLECIVANEGDGLSGVADLPSKQARGMELAGVLIRVGRPHRYGRRWWADYRFTDDLGLAVARLLAEGTVAK